MQILENIPILLFMLVLGYVAYWNGFNRGFREGKQNGYAKGLSNRIQNTR